MSALNIHASCVLLGDAGACFGAPPEAAILLLGESGAGKSSVALQLLARGAKLVSDDRAELFVRDDELWARAPANLAGLLEVRGVGIVALPHAAEAGVLLAIRLVARDRVSRYPEPLTFEVALAVKRFPPLILLSADDISVADRIVLAASAHANALFREQGNSPPVSR